MSGGGGDCVLVWLDLCDCHDFYWLEIHPTTGAQQQPMETKCL